ncbi:MAG: endolytic transglycosylase MltG [Ferruginibacter sp.]
MALPKKIIRYTCLAVLIIAGILAWLVFGSGTSFTEPKKSFFLHTGSTMETTVAALKDEGFIKNESLFKLLAKTFSYQKVTPGKYNFDKGASMFSILRKLKSGRQDQVNLVITKLRTKEDLAQKIGNNFECGSANFLAILNSNDSLKKFGLDTNTVMTAVIPNTYSLYWTTSADKIFKRLEGEQQKFWTDERKQKATGLGLNPAQVYTLASIVEEETNKQEDKGKIASVYLNRLEKGMRLAADPTVKFAMKNFALTRIYNKYLSFPSPYNTYINAGLPPGPICTPSAKTIDAVLDAPATSYLFFVAKPEFDGYSNFASTYEEHLRYAKAYQQALDSLMKARAAK